MHVYVEDLPEEPEEEEVGSSSPGGQRGSVAHHSVLRKSMPDATYLIQFHITPIIDYIYHRSGFHCLQSQGLLSVPASAAPQQQMLQMRQRHQLSR